ncbi:NAD(P)-dependent oxidoreductase [Pelagibacteraceae bacterium]|nr:NAD(P)-dependent oxidoreductase [Pelagibacteraceae bacterium]
MKKTYLVTGGLGFIGKAITISLLQQGHNIIVFDNNFREKRFFLQNKNLKIVKGDIRKKNDLNKVKTKIHSVIHLAAINGTQNFYDKPELVLEVGVKGIINIIDFCKNKNIKEIILASSSEVYQNAPSFPTNENVRLIIPDPYNPRFSYSSTKIISEILLLNSSFFKRAIIFRPHNIYGPDMGLKHVIPELIMKTFKAKKTLKIQGDGKNKRSFCYIDDFVTAFNIIIKKGKHKEIYNIGNTEEVKILYLSKLIVKLMKQNFKIEKSTKSFFNASRRLPDLKKLYKLGFKPKFSLNNGLLKTIEWYNTNYK